MGKISTNVITILGITKMVSLFSKFTNNKLWTLCVPVRKDLQILENFPIPLVMHIDCFEKLATFRHLFYYLPWRLSLTCHLLGYVCFYRVWSSRCLTCSDLSRVLVFESRTTLFCFCVMYILVPRALPGLTTHLAHLIVGWSCPWWSCRQGFRNHPGIIVGVVAIPALDHRDALAGRLVFGLGGICEWQDCYSCRWCGQPLLAIISHGSLGVDMDKSPKLSRTSRSPQAPTMQGLITCSKTHS